jgi:uncharacterized membrane protein (DUF106 family)
MSSFVSLVMQLFTPHYTSNPTLPNFFVEMIFATILVTFLNVAWQLLLKKTTNVKKINAIKNESAEFRKQLLFAIDKQDKGKIQDVKRNLAHLNKMNRKIQLQQWTKIVYYFPLYIIWILIAPQLFGGVIGLSPIALPFLTCSTYDVYIDTQVDNSGFHMGPCRIPGEVYLLGWFLIVNFGISGIISRAIKSPLPSLI